MYTNGMLATAGCRLLLSPCCSPPRVLVIATITTLQAQSSEALPAAVCTCLLRPHLFSSAALGTTEPLHEPTPSTSYLATDDGVSIAVQLL